MPGLLFPAKITLQSIAQQIDKAKVLLKDIDTAEKKRFLLLLRQRINDFKHALAHDKISPSEEEMILEQYQRFAQTLLRCIKNPQNTNNSINYYHQQFYYPVGIEDTDKPNQLDHNLAITAMGLGLSLIVGSVAVFILNPIIASITLSFGIVLLFPSCYFLLIPVSPGTIQKKEDEKELFQIGAHLIEPYLNFEEMEKDSLLMEIGLDPLISLS